MDNDEKLIFILTSTLICLFVVITADANITAARRLGIAMIWYMGSSAVYAYIFGGSMYLSGEIISDEKGKFERLGGLLMGAFFIICSLNLAYHLWN